eukprot:PhF_6_TR35729/c0_g1_i1/m.51879/K03768/PPIB, ppiB; peptidyl-prolyl cis-trans isomerase B (cyclophilin B)
MSILLGCSLLFLLGVHGAPDTFTHYVFFDIGHEHPPHPFIGRIVFGLYGNAAPLTVYNFIHLVNGTRGYGLKGSTFHRVVHKYQIVGGDFIHGSGLGGRAVFDDFNGTFPHEQSPLPPCIGCLLMAGTESTSQYIIQTGDAPWLNQVNPVFGKVTEGMWVVRLIDRVRVDHIHVPLRRLILKDCGLILNDTQTDRSDSSPSMASEEDSKSEQGNTQDVSSA